MINIKLIDNSISHNKSLSFSQTPTFLTWNKECDSKYFFYTDNKLSLATNNNSIAWLIEPPEIDNQSYTYIKNNFDKFMYVLTYNMDLNIPNSLFYPFGGCWIDNNECKIHDKIKNISFISSGKMQTIGHKLRNEVVNKVKGYDLYGRQYNPIENKITSLKDYRFQIVIENTKINDFFTEKIIDCFQTGTIPIYWGTESINKYFDLNGVITFNTTQELKDIINNLNEEYYLSKTESIKNNFELSKQYKIPEDWIYNNYQFLFN